jgi:glycyl-tRNA synthetase
MPFAAAQIGQGYRNEIAPRNGLLRVREFCMAEIEHFVHPENKSHPKFKNVAQNVLTLFSNDAQLGSGRTQQMTIGEAVSTGLVANETLGYFMARTHLFLEKVGVNPQRMRFRQHLKTEMAHYASDCWDLEIHLSYGWIECVGHADRACYDLQQHSNATGVPMVASEKLTEPVLVERLVLEPNRKLIGPKFKGSQKEVLKMLEELNQEELEQLQSQLQQSPSAVMKGFEIDANMVEIKSEKKNVHEIKYTPSVIEPSFGIGRVLYAILEHSFDQRENDEQRVIMKFPPCVAPIKVGIFRIVSDPQFDPIINRLQTTFQQLNIVCKVDSSSGTLGRKYARADEIGIPFSVAIDFQSLVDNTVTIRERNTMVQIRVPIDSLFVLMKQLTEQTMSWEVAVTRHPVFSSSGDDESEAEGKKESAAPSSSPLIVERTLRSAFSRPAVPIL